MQLGNSKKYQNILLSHIDIKDKIDKKLTIEEFLVRVTGALKK